MPRKRRIEPWPLALCGALFGMGCVLAALWWIAAAHPVALAASDAYSAGLAFNAEQAKQARAEALGWSFDVDATPEPGGVGVRVALSAEAAKHVVVRVRREHRSLGELDRVFTLEPSALEGRAGGFHAIVPLPAPGLWHLVVSAEQADARLERIFSIGVEP